MNNELIGKDVINSNGVICTHSTLIAERFRKEHKNVIQSIENTIKTLAEKSAHLLENKIEDIPAEIYSRFFVRWDVSDAYGRMRKGYAMTRDGFSLLVMGFTGEKAMEWKIKFLDAFNAMEEALKNIVPQLSEKDRLRLQLFSKNSAEVVEANNKLIQLEVSEAIAPLLSTIEEQKPKVEFAENMESTEDLLSIRELSKLAKDENLDIGEKRLFQWLRDNRYIFSKRIGDRNINEPYQKYIDQGLFKVVAQTYNTPYGSKKVNLKIMVTGKGVIYFINKLKFQFTKVA